jgi:dehydrogenase/reductase SDR family member 12
VPETTESTVVSTRDQREVFDYLADFSNLAEWDPTFVRSERLDDGPLGVGSRFEAVMKLAGREVEIAWTVTEYDAPNRVVLDGAADRFTSQEDVRVEPVDEGTKVTYTGRFDTDAPDLLDATSKPAFLLVGKAAIRGMHRELEEQTGRADADRS